MGDYKSEIKQLITRLGHRNWIVVADSAYPLQSNPGILTFTSDDGQLGTIDFIKQVLQEQIHVKAMVHVDKELNYVAEADAPGVSTYREQLYQRFDEKGIQRMLHEDIIHALDEASKVFNVVIIKTNLTIPYTSVFFQLDCKYWNAEAEKRLRDAMKKHDGSSS